MPTGRQGGGQRDILTSAGPLSRETGLLKMMAGAAVTRTEKSVRMGVRMARLSWCLLMLGGEHTHTHTVTTLHNKGARRILSVSMVIIGND